MDYLRGHVTEKALTEEKYEEKYADIILTDLLK